MAPETVTVFTLKKMDIPKVTASTTATTVARRSRNRFRLKGLGGV